MIPWTCVTKNRCGGFVAPWLVKRNATEKHTPSCDCLNENNNKMFLQRRKQELWTWPAPTLFKSTTLDGVTGVYVWGQRSERLITYMQMLHICCRWCSWKASWHRFTCALVHHRKQSYFKKKKKKKRINSPEELMKAKAFLCSRRVHMVKISSLLHPAGAGQIVHAPLG